MILFPYYYYSETFLSFLRKQESIFKVFLRKSQWIPASAGMTA